MNNDIEQQINQDEHFEWINNWNIDNLNEMPTPGWDNINVQISPIIKGPKYTLMKKKFKLKAVKKINYTHSMKIKYVKKNFKKILDERKYIS